MSGHTGKYVAKPGREKKGLPFVLIFLSFLYVEVFAFLFLSLSDKFAWAQLWPLAFGLLWAVILSGIVRLIPAKPARIVYGVLYFLVAVYAGFQTGYYLMFSEMMWLSDFRYASEGADYAVVLLSYPIGWWLGIAGMILLGLLLIWRFPQWQCRWKKQTLSALLAIAAAACVYFLPEAVFLSDSSIRYAGSDYGRAQSAEAAYDNMFNTHRLYQVCGLYQTLSKDIYANEIFPLTPGHARAQAAAEQEIEDYFAQQKDSGSNAMTGLLEGKNVVLVLMESMDDWMIGEHTPTINRLMSEGIHFTNFYTPVYGGIRTLIRNSVSIPVPSSAVRAVMPLTL